MVNYTSLNTFELLSLSSPGWGAYLLNGLLVSLEIAGLGYGLGLVIGMVGANAKKNGHMILKDMMAVYTTIVRAVPELVLILLVYFALPQLINQVLLELGQDSVQISGFWAGVMVIAVVQGAYATEVIRGALNSVPIGHIEAAQSFGMSSFKILHRITIPEMLPHAIPGLSNLWLIATKDTALLAVVGFTELTLAARQAAGATKSYFLFLGVAGILYLIVTLLSTRLFYHLERHFRRGSHDV